MKEIQFKYFLNGIEVEKEAIDWDRTMSVIPKNENEIHVTYMCRPSHTVPPQFNEEKDIERFCDYAKGVAKLMGISDKYVLGIDPIREEDMPYPTDILPKDVEYVPTGVKHNKHKAPLDILQTRQFPKALQVLALATAFGNKKYEETDKDFLNFKRVKGGSQTYFDAAARHNAYRNAADRDSGLPHGIHAVWNMLAALELTIEEEGVDVEEFSKNYLENLHKSK